MTNEELLEEIRKDNVSTRNTVKSSQEEIKRHASVLQEQFIKEVKTVAEGHDILRRDIQGVKSELKQDIGELRTEMRAGFNHMNKQLGVHDKKLANL